MRIWVNGKPIDLLPEKVYDTPLLYFKHGSGVVTIQKGDRKMSLDFNTNTQAEQ